VKLIYEMIFEHDNHMSNINLNQHSSFEVHAQKFIFYLPPHFIIRNSNSLLPVEESASMLTIKHILLRFVFLVARQFDFVLFDDKK
jgi:hypothetical protein